jgi:hypothetical protein
MKSFSHLELENSFLCEFRVSILVSSFSIHVGIVFLAEVAHAESTEFLFSKMKKIQQKKMVEDDFCNDPDFQLQNPFFTLQKKH